MMKRTILPAIVCMLAFLLIFSVIVVPFVCLRERPIEELPIKPASLLLKTVEWKFPTDGFFHSVDFNADGRSELVVRDKKGRWWWAEWNGRKPSFIPVPTTKTHPYILFKGQMFVTDEGNSLWLVTHSSNKWQKVRVIAKSLVKRPMDSVVKILDLDGDGNTNDALILTDFQTLEWWQRQKSGRLVFRDRLRLPKPCDGLYQAWTFQEWISCALWLANSTKTAFISLEKGRLSWKGNFACNFLWTDADVDGDGAKDRVEWWEWRNREELSVCFANGEVKVLKLPKLCDYVVVRDLDDDGRAEILVFSDLMAEQWHKELTLWRFDQKMCQWRYWSIKFFTHPLLMMSEQFPFNMALDKRISDKWGLLVITKRGDRLQVENLWLEETGWQSKTVAVLPKVNSGASSVIWTGKDLLFIEDQNPNWYEVVMGVVVSLQQGLLKLIGSKTPTETPITFLPHRIWGWHPEKRRWILLGHALSTSERGQESYGHWSLEKIGSRNEMAIVWWSMPNKVHIGLFRNGIWQAVDIKGDFDCHQFDEITLLYDGSRHWIVLNEGEKFLAVTIQ